MDYFIKYGKDIATEKYSSAKIEKTTNGRKIPVGKFLVSKEILILLFPKNNNSKLSFFLFFQLRRINIFSQYFSFNSKLMNTFLKIPKELYDPTIII